MPYLINKEGTGIAHMYGSEMEAALKAGWKLHEPKKQEVKPVEKEIEKPIIEAPAPKRGRPFKAFSRE